MATALFLSNGIFETEKTFLYITLFIISQQITNLVFFVAFSNIAVLLFLGSKTLCTIFNILKNISKPKICHIPKHLIFEELLKHTVYVKDKGLGQQKYYFAVTNQIIEDMKNNDNFLFTEILLFFGGSFA